MTPSEWLLEQFDSRLGAVQRELPLHRLQPIFAVKDDHEGDECVPGYEPTRCKWMSGWASWPEPREAEQLYDDEEFAA